MTKRWLLAGGLAFLLTGSISLWILNLQDDQSEEISRQVAQPEAASVAEIRWRSSSSQRYRVSSNSSMSLSTGDASTSQSLSVILHAFLDMHTLEPDAGNALVGMKLDSVDLQISGNADTEANVALSNPFRVRFSSGGYPQAFEYPAEISAKNRSILENLVRMFQVTAGKGDRWVAQEVNGSGSYDANYTRLSATQLTKSKQNFNAISFAEMFDGAKIESSELIRLDPAYDWITAMTVEERLSSKGQGGPSMTITTRATLELQPSHSISISAEGFQFVEAEAAEETISVHSPVVEISAQQARARILAAVPELNAATQGRTTWIHELRDMLRVDDAMPAVLLDILKTRDLSDRTRADLYLALQLADTDSAQQALVTVFSEPDWAMQDALRAVVALGGVSKPTSGSIAALWETINIASSGGERQRLGSPATFALGRLGKSLNTADDPDYQSLRSSLLDGAVNGIDDRQRTNFVHALGNTGDTTLSSDIVMLLNDRAPTVRRAAALSLGMIGPDPVAESLIIRFQEEENSKVRSAIAESLTSWTEPTMEANAVITSAIQAEIDVNARYNMARFLSVNLNRFPGNRAVLDNLIKHEQDKRIRQMVANALAQAD